MRDLSRSFYLHPSYQHSEFVNFSIAESFGRHEVETDETSKVVWQKELRRLVVVHELMSSGRGVL